MISTCVLGIFVRIQLLRMPGEERKFKCLTMVAFIPTFNCERDTASQTFWSDGISTMGVGKVSGTGDSVGDGTVVDVTVGTLVAVGMSVAEGVAVSGAEVEDDVATIALALSVVDVEAGWAVGVVDPGIGC